MDACRELGIPLIAYSPLGRGFLTGQIKSRDDIPEGDIRRNFERFSDENFPKNMQLVQSLTKIAERKGVQPSQLAIAWVLKQAETLKTPILPIPGSTSESRFQENLGGKDVTLTNEEAAEIQEILESVEVKGGRYNAAASKALYGESPEKKS